MRRLRLHWFWRGLIAAIAGLIVHALCATYIVPAGFWGRMFDRLNLALRPWVGDAWAVGLPATILFAVPSLALGFGLYGLLTWRFAAHEADGETHCRACGQILRGLSEPRCPECGERI